MKILDKLLAYPLLGLIWIYRLSISPLLGGNCRFEPSCSAYAAQSIQLHGAIHGTALAFKRIIRCHPFESLNGGHGFDPVPLLTSKTKSKLK